MDAAAALQALGIGLSRLLRYSYGGFLLVTFAALLNPGDTKVIFEALGWELVAMSAIVLGAGIYAAHRGLIVPLHHLFLCGVLRVMDLGCPAIESRSPTRWLGSLRVPKGWRILAYTTVRRSDIFGEAERRNWDVAHAESGLVLMTAEAFLLAALYSHTFPDKSQVGWVGLVILGIAFLIVSWTPGIGQHRLECLRFREMEAATGKITTTLSGLGMIREPKRPPNNEMQRTSAAQATDARR